jgi:hypothetical protein
MPDLTITLTISIPDGATVAVRPTAGIAVPASSLGNPSICPVHNVSWHFVPGGVSQRTGKPYNAFWACPEQGCKKRPPSGWRPPASAAPPDVTPGDDFDWSDTLPEAE